MVNGRTCEAVRQVARVFHEGTLAGIPDGEILERFVERRDESAFELLLRRHGPMVRRVCRQTLFDPHEVEDAFQATFLALVCKASSLRVEGSLGPWLYRVASRVAARARANRRRRGERERSGATLPETSTGDDSDRVEIHRLVHEELGHLPERLRAPLVLCYLEGMTHELAARELGCPVGTVRSRLARARALLHRRITRRGLVIPAAAMAAMLESSCRAAALPPQISRSLIKLATRFASGSASIGGGVGVSNSVAALLEGVLSVMRIQKLASLAAAMVAVGTLAAFVGVSAIPAAGQSEDGPGPGSVAKRVRPFEQAREESGPETLVKTYYVGDIIMPPTPRPGTSPATTKDDKVQTDRRWVDMQPLVALIASTVARGSWTIHDGRGKVITSEYPSKGGSKEGGPSRPAGHITPFFLSISLIIRCTPEVHEEVANLLRGLRRLQNARDNPGVVLEEEEERLGLPSPHPTDPKPAVLQPIGGEAVVPPFQDNRARIQQLLEALRQEVEKLPKDHN